MENKNKNISSRKTQVMEVESEKKSSRKTQVMEMESEKKSPRKTQVITTNDIKTESDDSSRSTQVLNPLYSMSRQAGNGNVLGEVIDGYKIVGVINDLSGQSVVYLAQKDDKQFALKLYKNDTTCIDQKVVQLLQNTVNHPSVIKIVASGRYHNLFYTVTPYYSEGSVIDHLDEIDSTLLKTTYIPQLNDALHAIHEAGIFHCDIKPHNFYFTQNRNRLIIGDFGIALPLDTKIAKKSQLGYYIPKRSLQKKEATIAYLSNEGDEYAASWVDYYALGMSLLNMAHRKDVYEDIPDDIIRDELMNNPVRISPIVDPEVAMLITKLMDGDNTRRLNYEGVNQWCQDTSCYGKYRFSNTVNYCPVNIKRTIVNGLLCTSTEEYVDALFDMWEWGLEQYKLGGIMNTLAQDEQVDRNFIKELAQVQQTHNSKGEEEIGYLITLLKLNPMASFRYKKQTFGDFNGYIRYLDSQFKSSKGNEATNHANIFFNGDVILQQLENEKLTKRITNADFVISKVKGVIDCTKISNDYKAGMIRNYFVSTNDFVFGQYKYASVTDLVKILFDSILSALSWPQLFNDVVLDLLTYRSAEFASKKETLEKIFSINDDFKRNAQFALFLTNTIPFEIEKDVTITCMYDIINYAKKLYENNCSCKAFNQILQGGNLALYYQQFPAYDKSLLKFIEQVSKFKGDEHERLTMFYNKTQENSKFIYEDKCISNMQDLFDLLGKSKNIAKDSANLLASNEFEMWLSGNGMDIALQAIKNDYR